MLISHVMRQEAIASACVLLGFLFSPKHSQLTFILHENLEQLLKIFNAACACIIIWVGSFSRDLSRTLCAQFVDKCIRDIDCSIGLPVLNFLYL